MRHIYIIALAAMCFFSASAVYADENQDLKGYYEQIHQKPELGKEEFMTAQFIRSKLKEFGYIDLLTVKAVPTTVIAVLDTGKAGPVICLRAEMDARKCQEQTGLPYASKISGLMHNCGHDAHAAILLETAHRLIKDRVILKGKIVFLFQPAEECAGGADDIVNDGILARLGVQYMFAQHCAPGLPVGTHTLGSGPVLAGSNTIVIKLTGRGGHAAQPHERDDLSGLAGLVTLELERLPSRCLDIVKYPTVCTISTSKWSSEQVNVAPDSITLSGTVRAFYDVDDKLFHGKSFRELLTQLVDGLAGAYGVKAEINLKPGSPVTVNNARLCTTVKKALESSGSKIDDAEKGMFSEDFSYYTAGIPSAYFGLGIAGTNYGREALHSAHFTVDEDCLESGVQLFVSLAKSLAKEKLSVLTP